MIYNSGNGEYKGFVLKEEVFDSEYPEKTESTMCLGNGYMGIRAANEEFVHFGSRGTFVAGTFDFLEGDCSTELPNSADVTNMLFEVNGEKVSPEGNISDYEKTLNLKNGLLRRYFVWNGENGGKLSLEFLRCVSLKDLHLAVSKVNVTALEDCDIVITSGIDGDVKGSGHFEPMGINAVGDAMSITARTKESDILFSTRTCHRFEIDKIKVEPDVSVYSESEMQIMSKCAFSLRKGQTLTVTKISNVFTNRDKERDGCDMARLVSDAREHMKAACDLTFEDILAESAAEWDRRVWSFRDIKLDTENEADQLAIRFALYHLTIMAPVHDNRMNIGAKGLSGPGYRGHSFWDTEIFMLPYYIFTCPDEARSLLEHRYNSIEASRRNAGERGYEGAMYPWESAWITDGEVTPSWATTGLMEHHITADVAVGVYTYSVVTGDEDFMEKCGYEMLFDTAKFWASRLEYNAEKDIYEITHVIGPDEYKEDIDNNAYTNYLARYNIQLAIKYYDKLRSEKPEVAARLSDLLGLDEVYEKWVGSVDKIYLPRENADGLVPQDDTYLTLRDITKEDCTLSEMVREVHDIAKEAGFNSLMVSKQADVMLLMYMFEDLFTAEVKKKNFYFYEKRCVHDSSLSLSTYSALAADLGEKDTAYRLFERASMIDIGPVMWSSHEGIHAASLGGIWQCAVFGFAGVRRYGEELRIEPHLPDKWNSISFNMMWKGQTLCVNVTHDAFSVENLTGTDEVYVLNGGVRHAVGKNLTIKL